LLLFLQEVSLPPKFCDDRVAVLQADARLLTPDVLQAYTADVSSVTDAELQRSCLHDFLCCVHACRSMLFGLA
jgi:hypothetical protein